MENPLVIILFIVSCIFIFILFLLNLIKIENLPKKTDKNVNIDEYES